MNGRRRLTSLSAIALLVAGCAFHAHGVQAQTSTSTPTAATASDWHAATVMSLGAGLPAAGTHPDDCRMVLRADLARNRFAEVRYRQGRRTRSRIALLPERDPPAVGDDVFVDLAHCDQQVTKTRVD